MRAGRMRRLRERRQQVRGARVRVTARGRRRAVQERIARRRARAFPGGRDRGHGCARGARRGSALEVGQGAARDVAVAGDEQAVSRSHSNFMHNVTLQPSGQQFQVEDGEADPRRRAAPGPACCPTAARTAPAAAARARSSRARVDYGVYQKQALTDEEKAQGKALFCQAKPLGDLVIEARTIGAAEGHPDQDAAVPRAEARARRRRRDRAAAQAAGERAAAVPRRAVHRVPAEGRLAAQLLHGQPAARRRADRAARAPRRRRASSPTTSSAR